MAGKARTYADVLAGEATFAHGDEARFEDMKAIASVIENRARALGVPVEDVFSRPSEFNAYGKALPKGASKYRDMAERAIQEVRRNGPTTNATFYAAPKSTANLPDGLREVSRTKGHVYYTDPQERTINTRKGYVRPDYSRISVDPVVASSVPTPSPAPRGITLSAAAVSRPGPQPAVASPRQAVQMRDVALAAAPASAVSALAARGGVPSPSQAPRGTSGGLLSAYAPAPSRAGASGAIDGLLGAPARGPGLAGVVSTEAARRTGLNGSALSSYSRDNLSSSLQGVMDSLGTAGFGDAVVNSGYRDAARNRRARGAQRSQHLHGNALDIDVSGWSEDRKAGLLEAAVNAGVKGVGLYSSGNSIHLDTREKPAVWGKGGTYAGMSIDQAPGWARPSLEAMYAGAPVAPRQGPMPRTANLPDAVMDRMSAPAMPALERQVAAAPQGLLGRAGAAAMGLLGATPAQAAANPDPFQPIMNRPTPASMVGANSPFADGAVAPGPAPVSMVGANSPLADGGLLGPRPAPAAAMTRNPHDGIPMPSAAPALAPRPAGPMATPTPAPRETMAPLAAPREVAPAPAIAGPVGSPAPTAAPRDHWGSLRSPTVPSVSPSIAAQPAAAAPAFGGVFNSNLSGPMTGAMLGGLLAGPVGALAGGLLGSPNVRQGLGFGGAPAARGNGITTGTITGQAIPQDVVARMTALGLAGDGFTGLGLPGVPNAPTQSAAAKARDRQGGRGDSGPSMSKSASDSIGKAGAGRGGLW